MATKYFEPKALPVAQLTTVTVGGTLAGETFTISVGGVDIASHTDTDTLIASTVAALVSAWNTSAHAYATGIAAADASPDITLTGDTGGAAGGGTEDGSPFILTLNTPGGAATFAQAETTSATGPHHFNNASNFSDGSLPGASDTVIIADTDINICWGLESVTATGLVLKIDQSYTGMIGLRTSNFAANNSGDVYDSTAFEYRPTYLQLDISDLEIGRNNGVGIPDGSQRIKIDNDRASGSSTTILNTSETSEETDLPTVRLKAAHASAHFYIQNTGAGGAGICVDTPGETSTIGNVYVDGITSRFNTGDGTTLTNWTQHEGINQMGAAATVTAVNRYGGTLTIRDGVTVTALVDDGAGQTINNGVATTTTIVSGGYVDGTQSGEARTWATVQLSTGTLNVDTSVVSITTLGLPSGKREILFT
ncbi:hypothetical protein KAR91_65180 [Candidatus Pacearchaeota archaeon]|nr:hypothetical protein [Candidatus Pacearchaeota archaeon]